MSVTRTFLDAAGSAPMSQRAREAFEAGIADGWADPQRLHHESRRARVVLEGARDAIADTLGVQSDAVHFTGSPQLAFERLVGAVFAARRGYDRILASTVERDAALHAAEFSAPHCVDLIPVDRDGRLDLAMLGTMLEGHDKALALVQHANQEVGTVQDIAEIHQVTSANAVPLIVDATASLGHIDPPAAWDGLVAHPADWGGPAGIAVVAVKPTLRWLPTWPEGTDWSAGPVSIPSALAAAVALQEREEQRQEVSARLNSYVEHIRATVSTWEGVTIMGDPVNRLPHVMTMVFMYLDGEPLLSALDRLGFAVGSGSACHHSSLDPSRVLASLGALTHGNIRLGLHPDVTDQDVEAFLAALERSVADVTSLMGATGGPA